MDDPSAASIWDEWIIGLECMVKAMRVTDDLHKYDLLWHYMGRDGRCILKDLRDNGEADHDFNKARKALTDFFNPKINRNFLLHAALQLNQSSETMDKFYMRIKEKITKVELLKMSPGEIEELIVLVILISGCNQTDFRKKTLKDGLSLQEFLKLARASEMAEQQVQAFERESKVNAV